MCDRLAGRHGEACEGSGVGCEIGPGRLGEPPPRGLNMWRGSPGGGRGSRGVWGENGGAAKKC